MYHKVITLLKFTYICSFLLTINLFFRMGFVINQEPNPKSTFFQQLILFSYCFAGAFRILQFCLLNLMDELMSMLIVLRACVLSESVCITSWLGFLIIVPSSP